ncbi:MAG: sugar phosphate isomerase/epimerase family protein [Armatimonadota bacterium]
MADKLKIGVMTSLRPDVAGELKRVKDFGLQSTQMACWGPEKYTTDNSKAVDLARKEYGVEISTLWTGYSGPARWNFTEGPSTIGLVPPEYRDTRVADLIAGAEFAAGLGIASITTHAGFIPENPKDALYAGTVDALSKVANRCKELGIGFYFETGQETPITVLRVMKDIGTDNLGVNLDPANLLMYGKANPVDALDIIGPYVKGVHAKDGDYPTEPDSLGPEKALGEGRVNFPVLVPKLKSLGYTGPITIEREISGDKQIEDIKRAIAILDPLC